jgi:hypothetical protein
MGARIVNEADNAIHITELEEGQVAQIVSWTTTEYLGLVVVRFQDSLVEVGGKNQWVGLLKNAGQITCLQVCRVRVLPKGTTIELT